MPEYEAFQIATYLKSSVQKPSVPFEILLGDFNLENIGHFEAIGFTDHIKEKTTLKRTSQEGNERHKAYDHILTRGNVRVCDAGVYDLVQHLGFERARSLSDHLPTYVRFTLPMLPSGKP
jgi:endonuclease/exonuclease/phosphatase family metal-dependent hydrolase